MNTIVEESKGMVPVVPNSLRNVNCTAFGFNFARHKVPSEFSFNSVGIIIVTALQKVFL